MNNNVKSATVAGLLGIFLGGAGAHDWYLGRRTKGIVHVALFGGGVLLEILVPVLTAALSYRTLAAIAFLMIALVPLGSLMIGVSGVWGFIEGIVILAQGDAGLARKGYAVAMPQMYGQPYNNGVNNNGTNQYAQNMAQGQNNWQNGGYRNVSGKGMQNGEVGNMNNDMGNGVNGGMNGQ